jgi:hypothetical protein
MPASKAVVMSEPRKMSLSPRRRDLLDLCQRVDFGQVLCLVIRDGEPVLRPPPRVVRMVKLDADNDLRRGPRLADYVLNRPIMAMFAEFDRLRNGTVVSLDIQHGLPFRIVVDDVASLPEDGARQDGGR